MKNQERNEKCNCGSGIKYKKCCMKTSQTNQPKNEYINTFGAYYKDDTLDGFSFGVMGYEQANMLSTAVFKMTEAELEDLEKTGEEFDAKECFKHLEDSIKYWNLHTIGSERRKEKHCIANVNFGDENILKSTMCIMQDIHILTTLGYIKNDNYNGMTYGYASEKF
jgi:hypothetical protein